MYALGISPDGANGNMSESQASTVGIRQSPVTFINPSTIWSLESTGQSTALPLLDLVNRSFSLDSSNASESVWWETTSESSTSQNTGSNLSADFVRGCPVVDKYNDYFPWNNPDNVISLDTRMLVTKVCGVFIPLVCLMGFPLNVVNCTVFVRLGLRDRINFLLFSLACADLMSEVSLFCNTVEYLYSLLAGKFSLSGPFLKALINSGATSMYGFTYVSGFISTLISFERCLCITYPFKARKFLRTRTTCSIVCVAAVSLVGMHYFVSEKYKMGCEYIPLLRVSISAYFSSEFYRQNTEFVNVLNVIVFGLFMPCFFVLVTSVTTIITTLKLRQTVDLRYRSSSAGTATTTAASNNTTPTAATNAITATSSVVDSKEIALTKMLIAVSCLFIACTAPNIIVRLTPLFLTEMKLGGRKENLLHFGIGVLYSTGAVNSSLNFFFYYRMGSKFRSSLKSMRCSLRRKPAGGKGRGMSNSCSSISTAATKTVSNISVVSEQ